MLKTCALSSDTACTHLLSTELSFFVLFFVFSCDRFLFLEKRFVFFPRSVASVLDYNITCIFPQNTFDTGPFFLEKRCVFVSHQVQQRNACDTEMLVSLVVWF